MKKIPHLREQGSLLLVSLGLLLGVAAMAGVALHVTSNTSRLIQRNNNLVRAEAAAEGALELAYAVWLRRIAGEPVSIARLREDDAVPPHIDFEYTEANGSTTSVRTYLEVVALDEYGKIASVDHRPPPVTGRVPGYEGWSGTTFTYAARARVEIDENTTVGLQRLFHYTEVPLFQSMFFYNSRLELYNPATIVLNGLIHTNNSIYALVNTSNTITINNNATYVDSYKEERPPEVNPGDSAYNSTAINPPTWGINKQTQLHKVPPIQPMGGDPEEVFNQLPNNPNDDGFRELIELPDPNHDDPPAIAKRRMSNKAGIRIDVKTTKAQDGTITTSVDVIAQRDTVIPTAAVSKIKGAFVKKISTAAHTVTEQKWDGKKWVNETRNVALDGLYDAREEKVVDVVNIDMSKIQSALDTDGVTGVHSNVIYLHDATENNVSINPKTFRLQNGHTLPANGLTIASGSPVYIQGDYNTGGTKDNVPTNKTDAKQTAKPTVNNYERKPAAVIADAVMFLSNSWQDSRSDQKYGTRVASNTTFNTAIMSGFKQTTATKYSGGAINYPRFLEEWSNRRCTYYGSMVELYESAVHIGNWDLGDIYRPPTRWWSFDTNFIQRPPPGSVEAVVLSRGPWTRF